MQLAHGQLVCVPSAPPDPPEAAHAPQSFEHVEQVSSPLHVPSPHVGSGSGAETAGAVTDNVGDARLGVDASDGDFSSGGRFPMHADNTHAATIGVASVTSLQTVFTSGDVHEHHRKSIASVGARSRADACAACAPGRVIELVEPIEEHLRLFADPGHFVSFDEKVAVRWGNR